MRFLINQLARRRQVRLQRALSQIQNPDIVDKQLQKAHYGAQGKGMAFRRLSTPTSRTSWTGD